MTAFGMGNLCLHEVAELQFPSAQDSLANSKGSREIAEWEGLQFIHCCFRQRNSTEAHHYGVPHSSTISSQFVGLHLDFRDCSRAPSAVAPEQQGQIHFPATGLCWVQC